MAVLYPGKFLYLCTPHTASYSTTAALQAIEGAVVLDHKHVGLREIEAGAFTTVKRRREGAFEILFQKGGKGDRYPLPASLYTRKEMVLSTIRNPYDIIATWWALDRLGFSTFAGFISELKDPRFSELDYLVKQATRVLRYEYLEKDLNRALADVGLDPVEIPRSNVTPGKKPWGEYYDWHTLDAVNTRFGRILDEYGYERL